MKYLTNFYLTREILVTFFLVLLLYFVYFYVVLSYFSNKISNFYIYKFNISTLIENLKKCKKTSSLFLRGTFCSWFAIKLHSLIVVKFEKIQANNVKHKVFCNKTKKNWTSLIFFEILYDLNYSVWNIFKLTHCKQGDS